MTNSNQPSAKRPAILGGEPTFPLGPPAWPINRPEIHDALQAAWKSGDWGRYHGRNSARLVDRMCEYLTAEHVMLCASGTAAVELALRGLKVGAGDEVILAAYDFKGNFQDVLALDAVPVLLDVNPWTRQLNLDELAVAVSPKTKAIIASHLHGGLVPMPKLMAFARERGILVLEDACQMPGAIVNGRRAGMWGDVGVWSFGGSKLLSAGRGGAIFTSHAEVAQRIRLQTQRGNDAYPLSELQAAVLLPQLERLEEDELLRLRSVETLRAVFCRPEILVPVPELQPDSRPGYYKLGLQYVGQSYGLSRDRFIAAMRAEGIAVDAGFRGLHKIHSSQRYRRSSDLRHASQMDVDVIVLHHPILLTGAESDLQQIGVAAENILWHADEIRDLGTPDCGAG